MNTLTLDDLHYTYADYTQWEGDWELIEGVPVAMSPAPSVEHQSLASEIIRQLGNQLEGCFPCRVLGEVDYKVEEETVVRPDVLVVCKPVSGAYVAQTPELIIEVVSPSSIRKDERIKFMLYEQEKVPYYVLVYPHDRRAKIYRIRADRYTKVGDVSMEPFTFDDLPCPLTLDFAQVFSTLD